MSWILLQHLSLPGGDYSAKRRKTLFAVLASAVVNVLPELRSVTETKMEFGVIYRYYGTERVLCEADDQIWPRTDPAFRLFHHIWFEGEEYASYVAHADFVKHPEFENTYPRAEDRRRLHFLNR